MRESNSATSSWCAPRCSQGSDQGPLEVYPNGYLNDGVRSSDRNLLVRLMRRAPLVLPAVAAVGLTLAACATGGGGGVVAAEQVQYSSPGEQVYQQSCARCHGWDRGGLDDAPALDATRVATLGDTPLRMTVLYGKGRMPGFDGLSQAQVDDLINFLRG